MEPSPMKKSIVLFSGGLDSTTAIYWALERYEKVFALTFDYGQRNRIELDMAGKVAQKLSVPQKILRVNLKQIGGSSLPWGQVLFFAFLKNLIQTL
ncbi:MAG TPA: hypothetical protein ENI02_01630 [Candidatus Aminicenantes bacterium]|nr:hypothetical protein [Candidatus Aminicenantes bacterium]